MNCRKGCSPPRRGGVAAPSIKMLRSLLMKTQTGWSVPHNVTTSTFTIMTTPSAPLRRLRVFFLLAQPPLLFQEGNALSWQFIHTFPVCGASVASLLFIDAAATPPHEEGNVPSICDFLCKSSLDG